MSRAIRRGGAGLVLLVLLALLAPAAARGAAAPKPPDVSAPSAIVVEAGTGDVAYARAPDRRRPIASTTKLMTALLVLERGELGRRLTAADYRPAPVESKLGLDPGERMRVSDLLRALLLASANDAAVTLAEGMSGSRGAFVAAMNRRARALGLRNTAFANPIGLDDPGNYSSARDLSTLARRLQRFAFFRAVVDSPGATLRSGARRRTIVNRNRLVRVDPAMTGIKTGHTQGAGYVLVASRTHPTAGRVRLVSAVLGTASEGARDEDTRRLLAWAGRRYRRLALVRRGRSVGEGVPIHFRRGARVGLVAGRSVRTVTRRPARALAKEVELRVTGLPAEVEGPLRRGTRVGTVEVRVRGQRVAQVPAVTAASIPAAGAVQQAKEAATRPWWLVVVVLVASGSVLLVRRRRGRPGPARRPRREVEAA